MLRGAMRGSMALLAVAACGPAEPTPDEARAIEVTFTKGSMR